VSAAVAAALGARTPSPLAGRPTAVAAAGHGHCVLSLSFASAAVPAFSLLAFLWPAYLVPSPSPSRAAVPFPPTAAPHAGGPRPRTGGPATAAAAGWARLWEDCVGGSQLSTVH